MTELITDSGSTIKPTTPPIQLEPVELTHTKRAWLLVLTDEHGNQYERCYVGTTAVHALSEFNWMLAEDGTVIVKATIEMVDRIGAA